MDVTDDGIETLVSDEHPLKASDPMDVTDDGIETLISDEHPEKAESSIVLINPGIFIVLLFLFTHRRMSKISLA